MNLFIKQKQTHRQRKISGDVAYIWNLYMAQMTLFMKQKQTHRYRKQIYDYQRGKGWGKLGVWD